MNINDYAHTTVPEHARVSGFKVAMVFTAVGLSLPSFALSAMIASKIGLTDSLIAFSISGFILLLMALGSAYIGSKTNRPTFYIIQKAFGINGSKIVNLVLAIASFGWFGITLSFTVKALDALYSFPFYSTTIWTIISGLLMTLTAVMGFKGLSKLTTVAIPLLFGSLIYLSYHAFNSIDIINVEGFINPDNLNINTVIFMLVGGWSISCCIYPDYARYSKNVKQGLISALYAFLPGFIALLGLSCVPALIYNEVDIQTLLLYSFPLYFVVFLIIISSWSTNDSNLYSTSLSLAGVFKTKKYIISIILGSFGIILSLLNIIDNFMTFLMFLGLVLPQILGIYIADFITNKQKYLDNLDINNKYSIKAFLSWSLGILLAISTNYIDSFNITTIPAVDGVLASFIIMYALSRK